MRTLAFFLLPATLTLVAQDDLASALSRAQGLGVDALRDLQGRLAASEAAAEAKNYHEAYLAYALGNQIRGTDPKGAEAAVARALKSLTGRKDADALALQGALVTQLMSFQPAQAMTLFPKAEAAYQAALKTEPINPRALLLWGVYTLHKPAFVGGGADKALPLLEASVRAAETEAKSAPKDAWAPRWGRVEAHAWLAVAQAREGKKAEAEATLAAGRALDPGHGMLGYAAGQVAAAKPKG